MSVATIGAVIAIGGTLYSVYSQDQAIKAANSAQPRPFVPVDINKTAKLAMDADVASYAFSDADWKKRFPKLALGRDYNVQDASNSLAGMTSPAVTSDMDKAGLSANLGTNEFQKARNLGMPILSMEQRDRNYFQKQLALNPQRTAGLSGQDVSRIAVANTGSQNNYNQGVYQSHMAQYNAGVAQTIQNQGAAIAGAGTLADLFIKPPQSQSPYLDPNYFNDNNHFGKMG